MICVVLLLSGAAITGLWLAGLWLAAPPVTPHQTQGQPARGVSRAVDQFCATKHITNLSSLAGTYWERDLNKAGEFDLTGLGNLDQPTAQRIITYRTQHGPFKQIEELIKVRGVTKTMVERLKHDFFIATLQPLPPVPAHK